MYWYRWRHSGFKELYGGGGNSSPHGSHSSRKRSRSRSRDAVRSSRNRVRSPPLPARPRSRSRDRNRERDRDRDRSRRPHTPQPQAQRVNSSSNSNNPVYSTWKHKAFFKVFQKTVFLTNNFISFQLSCSGRIVIELYHVILGLPLYLFIPFAFHSMNTILNIFSSPLSVFPNPLLFLKYNFFSRFLIDLISFSIPHFTIIPKKWWI